MARFKGIFVLVLLLLGMLAAGLGVGCGGSDAAPLPGVATDAGGGDAADTEAGSARSFNVVSVTAPTSTSVVVTFDAPPNAVQAGIAGNYTIPGLTLSGAPSVLGLTVTLTTNRQSAQTYTLSVANVTRASDGARLSASTGTFTGNDSFNVVGAASTGNTSMTVTFDGPPNATEATTLANYSVSGLTLTGTATLDGNVVTLETSSQADQDYTVTVSNVRRADDARTLTQASAVFRGRTTFNVESAQAVTATSIQVVFDAPPNAAQATDVANYSVPGLTVSEATLSGSTVTLTTSVQAAQTYTVTVTGVTRAADGESLVVAAQDVTGRAPFLVTNAASSDSSTVTVTFDAEPSDAQATTLASYAIAGLTLTGTPVLAGNVVTLTTSAQSAQEYTVVVTGVTRASDGEPLHVSSATFTGTPPAPPTVTNVVVASTNPDNGTTPYNTGTSTVTITGTSFLTVDCANPATSVKLDDVDGAGAPVGTGATACTVDSDTQITATFPAGIVTNGATGWNVIVTNPGGANSTSGTRFVPVAGLLITEVLIGAASGSGASAHEFVEVYNPTATAIDIGADTGIGLQLHVRNGSGGNTRKVQTVVTTTVIPSHGHLLFVSNQSTADDAWFANRDVTYSQDLVGNGGVYISLSTTAQARVIDKVGWGTQPATGFEGTATANPSGGESIQRKRVGSAPVDTDSNADDFLAPSSTITPKGTADPPES